MREIKGKNSSSAPCAHKIAHFLFLSSFLFLLVIEAKGKKSKLVYDKN